MTYDPTPLVEAAKKATQGEWIAREAECHAEWVVVSPDGDAEPWHVALCLDAADNASSEDNARYIIAAQPRNILALVDSFQRDAEAKDARIRELEVAVEDANLRAAEASSAKDQALHKLDDALMANATTRERIVTRVMQDVAELPDRTSPDGCPDMMLVTEEELEEIIRAALGGPRP